MSAAGARWRDALWRLLPLMLCVAALALARSSPGPAFAVAAVLTAVIVVGLTASAWLPIRGDLPARIVVGFAVVALVLGSFGVVAYSIGPPTWVVLAVSIAVLAMPLLAWLRRPARPAPCRLGVPDPAVVAVGAAALLAGILAALPGPYFPAGWDGPFHAATLRRLLGSAAWVSPDPYFTQTPLPVPQYGLDPWYSVLAVVATLAGTDALDTIRSVPPALAVLSVLGVAAVAAAAVALAGPPVRRSTQVVARLAAVGLGLVAWGALQAAWPWRALLLPEYVGTLVLLPAALAAWWTARVPPGAEGRLSRLLWYALLAGLGWSVTATHLESGASLAIIVVGETTAIGLAAAMRGARGERQTHLPRELLALLAAPAALGLGMTVAIAHTLPPLMAMVSSAGPLGFGDPTFREQVITIGPWLSLRPSSVLGSTLAATALLAAPVGYAIGWRGPGVRSLALGAAGGALLVLTPPFATLVAELASITYLRRLAAIPSAVAVPLAAGTLALLIDRMAGWGRADPWPERRAFVAVALAALLAIGTVGSGMLTAGGGPPWLRPALAARLRVPDSAPAIRRLVAGVGDHLPSGSVVLTTQATAYVLPTVLDVRVVAVPAIHSLSSQPEHVSIRGRTRAGQDVRAMLAGRLGAQATLALLERYGVDRVVVAGCPTERAAISRVLASSLTRVGCGAGMSVYTIEPPSGDAGGRAAGHGSIGTDSPSRYALPQLRRSP